jgi:ABC-type dipeptide/oligopeptide/nickel transport system permease subunit
MSSGSALMFKAPGIILFPGIVLALTVIAINIYGDALIRALDLRERLREA